MQARNGAGEESLIQTLFLKEEREQAENYLFERSKIFIEQTVLK